MKQNRLKKEEGSLELIVLGLLGALIVVLAIPLLKSLGDNTRNQLNNMNSQLNNATQSSSS